MVKYQFIFVLTLLFVLTGSRGEAFVPQTPHLLYLMGRQIKAPSGLSVQQRRQVPASFEGTDGDGTVMETFEEYLTYLFPGRFRSDIQTGAGKRFSVITDEGVIKVAEGRIFSTQRSPSDVYVDVLLYRDYQSLQNRLMQMGVDVEKVTFQRLEGRVCYLIGHPPYDGNENPGLWLDKESFFPVRYLVRMGDRIVDVRYESWQEVSKTLYPVSIRIFVNGRLFTKIKVDNVKLLSNAPGGLFDVNEMHRTLPLQTAPDNRGGQGAIESLDRALEDFSKLYD